MDGPNLRQVLQSELIMAMKEQDRAKVMVLRSVVSAISSKEAPVVSGAAAGTAGSAGVARRELTPQEVKLVVLDEVEARRNSVGYLGTAGRSEEAEALQNEVDILERYLYLT